MELQMGEIGSDARDLAELEAQLCRFLMREPQELIERAKFMHEFESRRMDRVAAEIAEEIGMFFEHDDVDASARQKQPGHHPGGPAAGHATSHLDLLHFVPWWDCRPTGIRVSSPHHSCCVPPNPAFFSPFRERPVAG